MSRRRAGHGGPLRGLVLAAVILVPAALGVLRATGAGATGDEPASARVFVKGVEAYEAGRYGEAADLFSRLAAEGLRSGGLCYNLGNAYLKSGDLGRAVLWYERARRLMPADADLRFNLEYARGLLRDEEPEAGFDAWQLLLFWNALLGRQRVFWTALALNALFWLLLFVRAVRPRWSPGWARWTAGALALVFILAASGNLVVDRLRREGVILPAETIARSGPTADATELFRLHAGAKVRVDRVQGGGVRIRYGSGRLGWIPSKDVGLVRATDVP